jgi:hypothetical protein
LQPGAQLLDRCRFPMAGGDRRIDLHDASPPLAARLNMNNDGRIWPNST